MWFWLRQKINERGGTGARSFWRSQKWFFDNFCHKPEAMPWRGHGERQGVDSDSSHFESTPFCPPCPRKGIASSLLRTCLTKPREYISVLEKIVKEPKKSNSAPLCLRVRIYFGEAKTIHRNLNCLSKKRGQSRCSGLAPCLFYGLRKGSFKFIFLPRKAGA